MSILVFGSTGQVASELALLKKDLNHSLIFIGRDVADLSFPNDCKKLIISKRPLAVINAAAWTSVDAAEENENEVLRINGESPGAMAKACEELSIPFIHFSSDYVFDGSGELCWKPYDKVSPLGIYGESKSLGEKLIFQTHTNAIILRTSWVFSAHGNNFVKTMINLGKEKDSLRVVGDQFGGPTSAASIAKTAIILIDSLLKGRNRGIYHFSGAPYVSWADFAKIIMRKSEIKCEIESIPSSSYPTKARRPKNSRLDCASIKKDFGINQSNWPIELDKVLKQMEEKRNET